MSFVPKFQIFAKMSTNNVLGIAAGKGIVAMENASAYQITQEMIAANA